MIEDVHEVPVDERAAAILALADEVGRTELAPRAQSLADRAEPPHENFAALARAGLLGLTIPTEYGGLAADSLTALRVLETLARYCAVTPFLLTQHTGTCGSIAAAASPLAPEILPGLARGDLVVGIGAAQLRRAGAPVLRADHAEGGYRIFGTVPWASGYGLMTHISLGAAVEGVGPLFFWVPFRQSAGMAIGVPQDLAVMRATATVTITCDGLFVPEHHVVGDDRGGYWRAEHGGALTNPVAFLLGIGVACLDGIRAAVARSGRTEQEDHISSLAAALAEHRTRYYRLLARLFAGERDEAILDALLAGRVEITRQVLRLAEIAIAAEGGSAHLRGNPAQRHLREASFFLTSTINASAREALVLGL